MLSKFIQIAKGPNETQGEKLPNNVRRGLEYHWRERDPKDNSKSKIPDNVRLWMPSIWVVEAYPPTFFSNLIHGIEQIGVLEQSIYRDDRNVLNQLNDMRSSGSNDSWVNLGIFAPKGSNIYPVIDADLPQGISHANIYLQQFVPSTTILISQFYLGEELINSLEEPLRREYKTSAIVKEPSSRYSNVLHQKREEYLFQIESTRTYCANWIDTNFPGLYSSNFIKKKHPVAELIVFEGDDPIIDGKNTYESYKSIMGFRSEFDVFDFTDVEGLMVILNERVNSKRSSYILAGNIERILKSDDLSFYGSDSRLDKIAGWSNDLYKTISFWALADIFFEYYRKQNQIRDKLGAVDISVEKEALNMLKEVEDDLSTLQANSVPLSNEISDAISDRRFKYDIFELEPMSEKLKSGTSFIELRIDFLQKRAISILENQTHLNMTVNKLSNLLTGQINLNLSEANNKLQRRIFWLTFIAVIIATFSFIDLTYSQFIELVHTLIDKLN